MSGARRPPPDPLSAEACAEALDVSRETLARLEAYVDLLRRWQRRRNLIGRGTEPDIWRRHILDCGQLAAHLPTGTGRIVDLGSGAGLPGIVLAILTGDRNGAGRIGRGQGGLPRRSGAPDRRALRDPPRPHRGARALAGRCGYRPGAGAACPASSAYAAPFAALTPDRPPVCVFPKGARWREELTDAALTWHISARDAPSATEPAARILIVERFARV